MKMHPNFHNSPLLSVFETHLQPDLLQNDVRLQVQYIFCQIKFIQEI